MEATISKDKRHLPYPFYQADKADILEKTSRARENNIPAWHDAYDMPDMQMSGGGVRGEHLFLEFAL